MRNRDRQINIRLSNVEYARLMKNVAKTKLSVSSYLRALIEENSPKEVPPMEYHELMSRLYDVSNQLASIFHSIRMENQKVGFGETDAKLLQKEMEAYKGILLEIQAAVTLPDKI